MTGLTVIEGLQVGHWTDADARTGCTVVLCPEEGCLASGSVRGSAPGTRETALLEPEKSVEKINAVVLSGGSAFGLAAAHGVVRFLAERGLGFETPFAKVPIVPAAVIYDLGTGSATVRPGEAAGYQAARTATGSPVEPGRIGAGTGATCGKYLGMDGAEFGGLGSAHFEFSGCKVAALSVANPLGDLVDPSNGQVVAGARLADGTRPERRPGGSGAWQAQMGSNTTLVIVATDAVLSKAEAKALAESAQVGIARVTRPSHTPFDGDTSFVLSTGSGAEVSLFELSVAVQEVVAEAILAGARAAN